MGAEIFAAEPRIRVHIHIDLTDVAEGELLDGIMHVTGQEGWLEAFTKLDATLAGGAEWPS